YLVRRLLENTSNESFVRMRSLDGSVFEEQIAPPKRNDGADDVHDTDPAKDESEPEPIAGYRPEPPAEFRRRPVRDAFAAAVVDAEAALIELDVPAIIDGESVRTAATIASIDPSQPSRVVA